MKSGRKQNSTTTVGELAILASSCGLVARDEQGRQAYVAWHANDPKAARAALFTRVAARRVAASAAKSAASAKEYPASWARQSGYITRAAAKPPIIVDGQYPAGWLRAAGVRR